MSIPDRLWRVVKGHWALAQERSSSGFSNQFEPDDRLREKLAEAEAQAAAYEELASALRTTPSALPQEAVPATQLPTTRLPPPPASRPGQMDPLEASYELLQLPPGATLATLEECYQARLAELDPNRYPAGSPVRATLEARRHAIEAAYQRVRDVLNPTETRFERLEF